MASVVKITYNEDTNNLKISCNNNVFDVSRICNISIKEWAFPFSKKGIKWNGIYDELRDFTDEDDFVVYFNGDSLSFEILKYALSETPAKLISTNNVVVIVYNENPFTTRITVNGIVFDTTRIQNRSIDEWVNPIHIRDLNWNGIYKELENYIGIDVFNIQFVGKQEFMKLLVQNCPKNIDVTYRMPNNISGKNKSKIFNSNDTSKINVTSNINAQDISAVTEQVKDKMKQEITDEEIDKNLENIPIKNAFIRKNAMAICAVISIILIFLPFCAFGVKATSADIEVSGQAVKATGFSALFGIEELKTMGNNKTFFAAFLFIIPVLIVVMNYIKQLKPYRRIIAIVAPTISILFEIITLISLRSHVIKYFNAAGGGDTSGVKFTTTPQIGFWLLLVSYILTAVIGLITYYGLNISKSKK